MQSRTLKGTQKRNVLVAVAGQTPAIITETLWAVEQQRNATIDEIRVITTSQGRRSVVQSLLGDNGQFAKYCLDYNVPRGRIAFSETSIYVLCDENRFELEDIRTSSDNTAAADQMFSLIQGWTKRDDEVLFCSAAGGRKTLGIYLAMSLMLCGRPDDSLSHILVGPEFESGVPDFYYPPPVGKFYQRRLGASADVGYAEQVISSNLAGVELADIPFLKRPHSRHQRKKL